LMFFPVTRTCSSWICDWTLSLVSLTRETISLPFSLEIPCWIVMNWRTRPPEAGSTFPYWERLQGDRALHELRLEDVDDRLEAEIVVGQHLDAVLLQGDFGLRSLEVVPLADLLHGLVDRVADLLHVHDRNDIERRHPLPSFFLSDVPGVSLRTGRRYHRTRCARCGVYTREVRVEIVEIRKRIDLLDDVLLRIFNERARLALEIGRRKKEEGLPVYDPSREKRIFERMKGDNPGPLDDGAVVRLFERVVDESRRLERIKS
jgi:chorismate mutase